MKKFTLLITCLLVWQFAMAETPLKHEFRATWLATVSNIDWPRTKATDATKRQQQQKELTDIFDKMVAGNMNACCMQVRSLCDAMYQSSYEPWSAALTGTRGKDPGYDPLAFAIEEAHKRGLELHIWVNPFRVTSSGSIATSDKVWQNASDWIIKYDNGSFKGQIIDPGFPEARAYVIKVLMEIVNNYDVDGILMDDYFYPYGGTTTEDSNSKSKHKPSNVVDVNQDGDTDDDWRRANVDSCMKMLYDQLQAVKPWVRFGMGPFGIWTTQKKAAQAYGISLPNGIVGLDDYDVQACNTVEWVKQGWVDYINPQLYWSTDYAGQDYDVLCEWWAKDVCEHFSNQLPNGKKVHFFSSQAAYHAYDDYKGYDDGVAEIQKQIDANRANLSSGYTGSVFYNTTAYCKMYDQLAASHFQEKALPPAMDWKSENTLAAPSNLTISGKKITWQHATAERFTVYVYPKDLDFATAQKDARYLQGVVYGTSYELDNIEDWNNTTVAVCSYDRFGVEHGVAIYGESIEPDITWELNGGELPTIEVPTNAELWETFKTDYDKFYSALYSGYESMGDLPITSVLEYTWPKSVGKALASEMMKQHTGWSWLRDYILSIGGETISDANKDRDWRFNLYAFFNATNEVRYADGSVIGWAECGDFTNAGLPAQWGNAYQVHHGAITLPSFVDAPYTLPTNLTHPEGYTFLGWWDNGQFKGEQLYVIPAGWKGTLYAHWKGMNTSIENITHDDKVCIYDIMGRMVGIDVNTIGHGIFIIEQNGQRIKIIR
jgi:uncharacterized lipoprotein YddW (UPF0748 family)